MSLSAKEVAEKLGTSPKVLRRFLRETSSGVGSGSRYTFETSDVARLKKQFEKWAEPKGAVVATGKSYIKGDGEKGMSTKRVLGKNVSKATKAQVKARAQARVDRLEAALKEKGLHISQITPR